MALHRCHAFLLNPKFVGILGYDSEDVENSVEQGMFIKALVRKLHLKVFSPGDFAMEEGEGGEEVYFLSRGTVAIIAGEHQVATLSGGDCFGEIALLVPGMRRTASIVATTFCEAHELFRQDFIAALRSFPEMHTRHPSGLHTTVLPNAPYADPHGAIVHAWRPGCVRLQWAQDSVVQEP